MSGSLVRTSFVETGDMYAPIAVIKLNRHFHQEAFSSWC
jgi:hypothetical protein